MRNWFSLLVALTAVPATGQPYPHVVITCDSFVTHFAPLCAYVESSLGLNDTIVTTRAIYGAFPGRDRPEQIRNFIRHAYQNWGTTHVLLGGDVENIPCRRPWVDATPYNPILLDSIPADLYYADLDGDWDFDGDGLFGEPEDSCDMYPDVFIGRAPATTVASASLFVSKFLTYANDPNAPYLRNVLLAGFDIFENVYCETTMELYDSAYVPVQVKPCAKVYDRHTGNHKTAVTNLLNQGQHVWIHADHCNYYGMGMGHMNHGYVMDRTNLAALTNAARYTIMTSVGCFTGEFDTADCAAEHFMLAPNGGGVAVASNSRYGLAGDPTNPQREYSFMLVEGFVRALFAQPCPGSLEAIARAWAEAVPLAEVSTAYRWCLFEWNLLGEAAMPVWIPAGAGVTEQRLPATHRLPPSASIVRGSLILPAVSGQRLAVGAALLDAAGRKVLDLHSGANDLSGLSPGVYFIRDPGAGARDQSAIGGMRRIVRIGKE
jgi:hypothetical protein